MIEGDDTELEDMFADWRAEEEEEKQQHVLAQGTSTTPENNYTVKDLVKQTGLSTSTVNKLVTKQKPDVVGKRKGFLLYGQDFLNLLGTEHKPWETRVSLEEYQELRGKFEALQQQLKKTEEALETLTTVQGAFEIKTTRVVKALIAAQKLGDTKSL